MKIDQAVSIYMEYHRMNSGKKYRRVLRDYSR